MTFPDPIHDRLDVLPTDAASGDWKGFERFCLELVQALPDVASASFYGGEGDAQDGIDILAVLIDSRQRTYQCKKYKRFTPKQVEKAIKDTTYVGAEEHVLLVACATTRKSQDEVHTHAGWTMLDQQGISSLLRSLDREVARRLVEDHFGTSIRRAFLAGGTTTFVEPAGYFAPFTRDVLFRHTWALAGREDDLAAIESALSEAKVIVLPGRGGIGKSRLLRALAENRAQRRVLFALDDVTITPEAAEDLPFAELLVVVDDVHRRDDLGPLLAEAARRSTPTQLVLATRPQGIEELRGALARAGFAAGDVHVAPPLRDLTMAATEDLAHQALGSDHAEHAAALAAATRDCPLVTVVGGQLLAARAVDPALLERQEDFRDVVLRRWSDEMLGKLGPDIDPEQARGLLRLVAALAPMSVEDEVTLAAIAAELSSTPSQVRHLLGTFETAGLVLARGRLRRVMPDVLADHVLHVACLDDQGRAVGYADDLVQRYGKESLKRLLRNLAELDWRIGQTAGASIVLDEVWNKLTDRVTVGDAGVRLDVLTSVEPAAVYAPHRVLDIVRACLALSGAAPAGGEGPIDAAFRRQIPRLVARVGTHPELVAEALALLWELGRDVPGPLHSYPDHPLRLAHRIGAYDMPLGHAEALLDLARTLLGADDHLWSPLTLLEPLVERTVETSRSEGFAVQLGAVFVDAAKTTPLRQEAFALISGHAREGGPREQHLAAELIGMALRPPEHIGGSIPADQTAQWRDEEHALIALAGSLIANGPALVAMELRKTLKMYTNFAPWPDAEAPAQQAVDLPVSDAEEMLAVFADPWSLGDDMEAIETAVKDFGERLGEAPGDHLLLAARMDDAVATLDAAGQVTADPRGVLSALAAHAPDRGVAIASWLATDPDRPLARFAGSLLGVLRTARPDALPPLLSQLDDAENASCRRQLADYLNYEAWRTDPTDHEIACLRRYVRDPDLVTRSSAILAVLRLSQDNRALAIELALEADTSAGPRHAEWVDQVLADGLADLPDEALDRRLGTLATEPKLEYWSWNLLVKIGATHPKRVLNALLARVRHHVPGFDALPYHHDGDPLSGLDDAGYQDALETVLGAVASTDQAIIRYQVTELFWTLDRDVNLSLATLEPWLVSTDEHRCKVAADVLFGAALGRKRADQTGGAGWALLTARPDYVTRVLEGARAHGAEHLQLAMSGLLALARGGSGSRTIGALDPAKSTLVEQATTIMDALPATSAARVFWSQLIRSTKAAIDDDRLDDEEFGEEAA